jgi:hypothetical protein
MAKPEQTFLIELKNSFKTIGGLWFKIPDAPTMHQVAKPYDVEYTLRGTSIGIEAKYHPCKKFNHDNIPNLLRPAQKDGLTRKYAAGGLALVVVRISLEEALWFEIRTGKEGMTHRYVAQSARQSGLWTVPLDLLKLVEDTRFRNITRYDDILDSVGMLE